METLEFEILPCGTKAKTVNPLGKFVKETGHSDDCHCSKCEDIFNSWQAAEKERKTYEIDPCEKSCWDCHDKMIKMYKNKPCAPPQNNTCFKLKYKPGTIHSGILVNGRVKIL